MLAWYLLLLVPVAAIAYVVWAHRRKFAAQQASSREREMYLLGTGMHGGAPGEAPGAAGPGNVAAASPASPEFLARERFLGPAENLVYRLLRSALHDHEVFARVALGAVVRAGEAMSPYDREQRARRLEQQRLDFVICDKNLRVVAAVELENDAADASGARRFKAECLKAAGIRLVHVNPAALPRREGVRALVVGGDR